MGLFEKKDRYDDDIVSDMSDKKRKDKIERLEEQRDDVVRRIEKLMIKISREANRKEWRRRRFPLGDAPNDREYD